MTEPLDGVVVLVTRPAHQADELARLVAEAGGEALRFPTLEIDGNVDREKVATALGDVSRFDIAIFISANAVTHGVSLLPDNPATGPRIAAIGPSTARALTDAGYPPDIRATRGFTSEALLLEAAFEDVAGKRIVIFRGVGGRAMLGQELQRRGAEVVYAEVYRRDRPLQMDGYITAQLASGAIDAVTATSAETLVNLYDLTDGDARAGLLAAQLVTASERVVKKAAALGFEREALLADAAGDDALVRKLIEWRRNAAPPVATEATMTKAEVPPPAEQVDKAVAPPVADAPRADTPAEPELSHAAPRGGRAIGALALLLALVALGMAAWLWWQGERGGSERAAQSQLTAAALEEIRRGLARLETSIAENDRRASDLTASRGRLDGRIDDVAADVETLANRLQAVEKSVDDVRGVSAAARDNWVRAEAEYYLQAANSRLQLARDPDAALAALLAADDRLGSLGDPAMYRVRQTLAAEIEALRAVPRPDVEGIAHTLNGLAGRVDEMPIANSSESLQREEGSPEVEGDSAMARFRSTMAGVLGDIVSIRRTEADIAPLLSRDEEFFLRRNLELQLQTARLALLRGDEANYRESVRTARSWIQRHFVTDAAVVGSALDTLRRLEGEDIAPSLPDISGSLRQLRRAGAASDGDAA